MHVVVHFGTLQPYVNLPEGYVTFTGREEVVRRFSGNFLACVQHCRALASVSSLFGFMPRCSFRRL